METNGKPTVVHLTNSSCQPVLWVMEELGVDYNLKRIERSLKTPTSGLKDTHPLGKSPQFITPSGRVITQLSAVILHILQTYDTEKRFHGREGIDDPIREEELVCLGVADLGYRFGAKIMFDAVAAMSPFPFRFLFSKARDMMAARAIDPDVAAIMDFLEAELAGPRAAADGPDHGDKDWFMGGKEPSRPDFVLRYFMDLAVQSRYVDLGKYPRLKAWYARSGERPAWKRGLEKGNGYNLDFLSQI